MRLTIPLLFFTATVLAVAQTASVPAWADPTPLQINKCQWKKHRKAGRYQACVQDAVVEKVKNPAFDLDAAKAACAAAFETAWELQEANAAAVGEVCLDGAGHFAEVRAMLDAPADRLEAWLAGTRWVNNGDGTATDSTTGLQWELKTDDGSVHDKDNLYSWNTTAGGTTPNGTAFTAFLGTLNSGVSGGVLPVHTTGCFAGRCDWRLPKLEELAGILDFDPEAFVDCATDPCTSIPGFTQSAYYWSSSTDGDFPDKAWMISFTSGFIDDTGNLKSGLLYVRAVRGGS